MMRMLLAALVACLPAVAGEQPVLAGLPKEFTVHAVGTYAGKKVVPVRLDKSDHDVTQIDVVVNRPGEKVLLVLTAYDPVVWRVGRTKATTIVGVLVSGYHGQALTGIERATPHAVSTYMAPGTFKYFYATGADPKLLTMNDRVKAIVGKEIKRFHHRPVDGVFHVGDIPDDPKQVIRSDDLKVKFNQQRPVKAKDLIAQLVQQGAVRPATRQDIQAWVDKASAKYQKFGPDLRVSTKMRVGRTYVVLKKMTLPKGMHGAHSRAFIIPANVPFPDGPRGHNRFYLMDGTKR